jgi:histidinol-phosphate aminotransferase
VAGDLKRMSFFRDEVERMTAYVPGEQPPAGSRVIKLNTNENPYPPSPAVARAIAEEVGGDGERLRLYSDPTAALVRRAAAAQTGFPEDRVVVGNGSDELLALLFRAAVNPGDVVAYPFPTYVLYETLAAAAGARVRTPAFGREFALPAALRGSDAKLVFIASPNSPSGNAHPVTALEELARSLKGGLLVIDEAYADFAEANALSLALTVPNVVVLRTFSKSYSLAGMRLGLLFAAKPVVDAIGKVKDSYNVDRLAIVAGAAALSDAEWMRGNVEKIRATRARLVEGLRARGLDVLPSSANFVFARYRSAELARAAYQSLKQRGILVRYFDRPTLDDGLRITVGTDHEIDALLGALSAP